MTKMRITSVWPQQQVRSHLALKFTTAVSGLGWHLAPASLLVLMGSLLFPSAGHDDTHITCWPAYTLSRFGQILNYNGERVEQSSSLLQVLLLAALHKLTNVDLLTLAKLSSIAFGIATVLVLFTLVARVAGRTAGFCAALIAAVSTPIVYWSFSGMETSLVSFTGLCLVLTSADYIIEHPAAALWKPTLALAAFALVRPETPLLTACFLGSALAIVCVKGNVFDSFGSSKAPAQRVLRLLLVLAIVCGGLFAFRWSYFGALVPQPAIAKFRRVSMDKVVEGLIYFKRHAWIAGRPTMIVTTTIALSIVSAAVSQLRARTPNLYVVLSLLFVGGYACCVVISGGDWMEGGRFLAHFLPVAIGLVPVALAGAGATRRSLAMVAAVLIALEGRSAFVFTLNMSPSLPLWADMATDVGDVGRQYSWFERHNRINVRDMWLIDRLDDVITQISSHKRGPIILISGQMGIVPYHLALRHFGRVRFLDRFGLIERSLTNCAVTRDSPRDTGGLIIAFDEYFAKLAELEQRCQIARPDVMYSWGDLTHVEPYGYRAIYFQTGKVEVTGTRVRGAPVLADSFFAVAAPLLALSGPLPATHFDFGNEAGYRTVR